MEIKLLDLKELAPSVAIKMNQLVMPSYGRFFEDYQVGEVYVHPRGVTVTENFIIEFATTFMEANPLHLNREFAKAHGFKDILASPLLVMNLALSLGVQNDSEKVIANLGYYNVKFCEPVYPGDTLRGYTQVLHAKDRGAHEPGIVTIRTVAVNQEKKIVVQYERKLFVPRGKKTLATTLVQKEFSDVGSEPVLHLPEVKAYPKDLTGVNTYFENFKMGDVIIHPNGRTVTDEHFGWTYRLMNTHPLHYDKLYSKGRAGLPACRQGKMSGEPIVYGGLVFAWLCGLASRDVSENALWDLGYTEGYHTQPLISGETIYAISRVLAKEDFSKQAGIVSFQLVGVKGLSGDEAVKKFGADLFVKENDKVKLGKEKIPDKIFEIERRLLVKR